jgi:hypothetical protein
MPTPEKLGVSKPTPPPAPFEWTAVSKRLQDLGATGCHLDSVQGGYRFTCWLPGARPGVQRRIEASATSEGEAARLALERAAQERSARP